MTTNYYIGNNGSDTHLLPALSSMHLALYTYVHPLMMSERRDESFYTRIAGIPQFFKRIVADHLHTLVLKFDPKEATLEPLPCLEELRKLQGFMESTLLQRYPCLRKITLDIGCPIEMLPWWKMRLAECYPKLLSKGMLDIMTTGMRWYVT